MKKINLLVLNITSLLFVSGIIFSSCNGNDSTNNEFSDEPVEIVNDRDFSTLFEARLNDFSLDQSEKGSVESLNFVINDVRLSGLSNDSYSQEMDVFIGDVNEGGISFKSNKEKADLANLGSEYKLILKGDVVVGNKEYSAYVNFNNKNTDEIRGMLYIEPKPDNMKFDGPLVIEFKGRK